MNAEICEGCNDFRSGPSGDFCELRWREIRYDVMAIKNATKRERLRNTCYVDQDTFEVPERCPYILEQVVS